MTISQINAGGGNTTLRFEITRPTAVVTAAMRTGAFYLYSHETGHGVVLPEGATEANLTLGQIADIWDNHFIRDMREIIKTQRVITATDTARTTAEGEQNL